MVREKCVDGLFRLFDGDADVWCQMIEHRGTFRSGDGQTQFFRVLGYRLDVTGDHEQGVFESLLQLCQCSLGFCNVIRETGEDGLQNLRVPCGH